MRKKKSKEVYRANWYLGRKKKEEEKIIVEKT